MTTEIKFKVIIIIIVVVVVVVIVVVVLRCGVGFWDTGFLFPVEGNGGRGRSRGVGGGGEVVELVEEGGDPGGAGGCTEEEVPEALRA